MSRPALEVADIFRTSGPAYRAHEAGHLSLGQLRVMSAIEACRTAALGGHVITVSPAPTVKDTPARMFTGPAALDSVSVTSSKLIAGAEFCIGDSALRHTGDMG